MKTKGLRIIGIITLVLTSLAIGITIDKVLLTDNNETTSVKTRNATEIAIVNSDEGVITNDETVNYATNLINKDDYNFDGLTNAKNGIENGTYGAYVVVPSDFSKSIVSLNSTPKSSVISYELDPKLSDETKIEVIKKINEFENYLDTKISNIYLNSLLNQLKAGQESANIAIENSSVDLKTLNNVSALDLTQTIEIKAYENVEDKIAKLDLTEENNRNQNVINEIDSDYENLNTNITTETNGLKNTYTSYTDSVNDLINSKLSDMNGYSGSIMAFENNISNKLIISSKEQVLAKINDSTINVDIGGGNNADYILVAIPKRISNYSSITTVYDFNALKTDLNIAGVDSNIVNNMYEFNTNTVPGLDDTSIVNGVKSDSDVSNTLVNSEDNLKNQLNAAYTNSTLVNSVNSNKALSDVAITNFDPKTLVDANKAKLSNSLKALSTTNNNVIGKTNAKQAEYDSYSNAIQNNSNEYATKILKDINENKAASDTKLTNGLSDAKIQLQKSLEDNKNNFHNYISIFNNDSDSTSKRDLVVKQMSNSFELVAIGETEKTAAINPNTFKSQTSLLYIIDAVLALTLLSIGGTLIYKNQKKVVKKQTATIKR